MAEPMADPRDTVPAVLLPVYNSERYLRQALESVLAQSHRSFELIAVDDGSTDGSGRIIEEFSARDARVKHLRQANAGMAAALNRGLQETRAEWVFRMDGDDVMLPQRIERQLEFIREHPRVRVSACRARYIDASGTELGKTAVGITREADLRRLLERNDAIGLFHPGVILHRPTILAVGGYRGKFWPAEDIDLWGRLAEAGHLILCQNEVLMKYRLHAGSVSTSSFARNAMVYQWVRSSMRTRRMGRPEPTWSEFQAEWNRAPLVKKLDRWRKRVAKQLYRQAGFDLLRRYRTRAAAKLLTAFALEPGYVVPRLGNQLRPDRSKPRGAADEKRV